MNLLTTEKSALTAHDFSDMEDLINTSVAEIADLLQINPPVVVMGKQCCQRRDVGFFSDMSEGYKYFGSLMRSKPFPPALKTLLEIVNARFQSNYNGILINRYNGGTDYIGKHSDDERTLDPDVGVLVISVGTERKFRIRHKTGNFADGDSFKDFRSSHMTGFVMSGMFQGEFTHEVPVEKKVGGVRYSLTFRFHTR